MFIVTTDHETHNGFTAVSRDKHGLVHSHLLGLGVGALEQPGVGEDEELEGVLEAAQVADVHHRKAVQLVQAGVLEPEKRTELTSVDARSRVEKDFYSYFLNCSDILSFEVS